MTYKCTVFIDLWWLCLFEPGDDENTDKSRGLTHSLVTDRLPETNKLTHVQDSWLLITCVVSLQGIWNFLLIKSGSKQVQEQVICFWWCCNAGLIPNIIEPFYFLNMIFKNCNLCSLLKNFCYDLNENLYKDRQISQPLCNTSCPMDFPNLLPHLLLLSLKLTNNKKIKKKQLK